MRPAGPATRSRSSRPVKTAITDALAVARILWPEFKVVGDLVFFAEVAPEAIDPSAWHDRTELESSVKHLHILDLFSHGASLGDLGPLAILDSDLAPP